MAYFITNYYKTKDVNYNIIYYNKINYILNKSFEYLNYKIYKSKNKKIIKYLIKNKLYNLFMDKKKSKYAYKHGCPWSKYTCVDIVRNNNLKYLNYVHKHNHFHSVYLWSERDKITDYPVTYINKVFKCKKII